MTAKTISFSTLVKLADKQKKPTKEDSYRFTRRTFQEPIKPPGKHKRADDE